MAESTTQPHRVIPEDELPPEILKSALDQRPERIKSAFPSTKAYTDEHAQQPITASRRPYESPSSSSSSTSIFKSIFGAPAGPWLDRPKEYYSGLNKPAKWEDLSEEDKRALEALRKEKIIPAFRTTPWGAGVGGLVSGGVFGFVGSALQNAVQKHDHGWKGVFTRTGGTIWTFALAGGAYGFVDAYAKKTRQTDDAKNKFAAGCVAGFILGMQNRSIPLAIGTCVFLGTPVAVLHQQGGSLRGDGKFEYTSLAGQKAERYSIFRPPPMTQQERQELEEALKSPLSEAEAQRTRTTSPALKTIIDEKKLAN